MNLSKSSIRTERSFTRRKQQDAAINISAANLLTPMGNQPSLRGSRISQGKRRPLTKIIRERNHRVLSRWGLKPEGDPTLISEMPLMPSPKPVVGAGGGDISPSRREVIFAQNNFRDLYNQMTKRVSRLEAMTNRYFHEGPLKSIKQQTAHYSYLFSHILGDLSLVLDGAAKQRLLSRTAKYSNLVSDLLNKANRQITRLTSDQSEGESVLKYRAVSQPSITTPADSNQSIQEPSVPMSAHRYSTNQERLAPLPPTESGRISAFSARQSDQPEVQVGKTAFFKERSIPLSAREASFPYTGKAGEVFEKFLANLNLDGYFIKSRTGFELRNAASQIKEFVLKSFQLSEQIVFLRNRQEQTIKRILNNASDLLTWDLVPQGIKLFGPDPNRTRHVSQLLRAANTSSLPKTESIFQLPLPYDSNISRLKPNSLGALFAGFKVGTLAKDPLTCKNYLTYAAQENKKAEVAQYITQRLNRVIKTEFALSQYAERLLTAPILSNPDFTILKKLESLHNCSIHINPALDQQDNIPALKFKIEQKLAWKVEILALDQITSERVMNALRAHIGQWESGKRFFKVANQTIQRNGDLSDVGGDVESLHLSSRSLDLSVGEPADWDQIVNKLGLRRDKTDFALAFQLHFHVAIYLQQTRKFRGIMIYGDTIRQRLACLELGSLFSLHSLARASLLVEPGIAMSLDLGQWRQITARLRVTVPRAEFFLLHLRTPLRLAFAILFAPSSALFLARKSLQAILDEYRGELATEILPRNHWLIKRNLEQMRLDQHISCFCVQTEAPINISMPQYQQGSIWKHKAEGSSHFERYPPNISQLLERYYQEGAEYCVHSGSNFSFPRGQPHNWIEQSSELRYTLRRDRILVSDPASNRLIPFPGRIIMLKGFRNVLEPVVTNLTDFYLEFEKKESTRYQLSEPLDSASVDQIESRFEVILEQKPGLAVLAIGEKRQAAIQEYRNIRHLTQVEVTGAVDIGSSTPEYEEAAALLQKAGDKRRISQIQRVWDAARLARFEREKVLLEERKHNSTEILVFSAGRPDVCPREFFRKAPRAPEVTAWRFLAGKSYRGSRVARRDWAVPPRFLKMQYQLDGGSAEQKMREMMPYETSGRVLEIQIDPEKLLGQEYYDSVELGDRVILFNKARALPRFLFLF